MYDSVNVAVVTNPLASRTACASALAEAQSGVGISRDAALQLIDCADDYLPELLAAARAAKERFKPGAIT